MEIRLAQTSDIDCWMALVNQVKDVFPGLETEAALAEHRTEVLRFIDMNCAICAKEDDRLAGALLFSKENSVLCFLAVSPHYRRQHIGRRMFDFMLTQMDLSLIHISLPFWRSAKRRYFHLWNIKKLREWHFKSVGNTIKHL